MSENYKYVVSQSLGNIFSNSYPFKFDKLENMPHIEIGSSYEKGIQNLSWWDSNMVDAFCFRFALHCNDYFHKIKKLPKKEANLRTQVSRIRSVVWLKTVAEVTLGGFKHRVKMTTPNNVNNFYINQCLELAIKSGGDTLPSIIAQFYKGLVLLDDYNNANPINFIGYSIKFSKAKSEFKNARNRLKEFIKKTNKKEIIEQSKIFIDVLNLNSDKKTEIEKRAITFFCRMVFEIDAAYMSCFELKSNESLPPIIGSFVIREIQLKKAIFNIEEKLPKYETKVFFHRWGFETNLCYERIDYESDDEDLETIHEKYRKRKDGKDLPLGL